MKAKRIFTEAKEETKSIKNYGWFGYRYHIGEIVKRVNQTKINFTASIWL